MAPFGVKKTKKRQQAVACVEQKRRSLLDVINENMAIANRRIYVHRLIYIGRHTFPPGELNSVQFHLQEAIETVNSRYCDEFLTGFLLHYPAYFCHVVEGSESSLKKHLKLIYENEAFVENVQKPKILVVYHHINQRFLNVWTHMTAKPPTLLEKIDITTDLENTTAKIMHCVQKLYKLGYSLRAPIAEATQSSSDLTIPSEEGEEVASPEVSYDKRMTVVKSTFTLFDDIGRPNDALPEYSLLEFLIESPYVRDLREYFDAFENIPVLQRYEENAWPASTDHVPRNIFDAEYDPVTDLPSNEQEEDPDLI